MTQKDDALVLACEAVQQNVGVAIKFLKERLASFKAFQQMPWYLIIGLKSSGKTQLMAKSEMPFLEMDKFVEFTPEGMDTQGGVNWWFSPSAVLIDVPGYYLEESETLTPQRAAWFELLRQIRRSRFRRPLSGVIVTIDVKNLRQNEGLFLRSRLQEIVHRLKQKLPIYIAVTQTDQIQGFCEYFDDLGKSERDQFCGITLPLEYKSKAAWTDVFAAQFDQFIMNLHQRVLWRVHQERENSKRQLILNFPHQLNSLKENLKKLIYDFSNLSSQIALRGVYFTSSVVKDNAEMDQLGETMEKHFALIPMKPMYLPARPQQAFFIKSLFEQKIFPESRLANDILHATASRQDNMIRWGALGLAGIILLSVVGLLSHQYQQQTAHLNTATAALSDYKLLALTFDAQNPQIDKLLPALDALQLATQSASEAHLPWLLRFQLHREAPLPDLTNQLYDKQLKTKFIPAVRAQIENQLKSGTISDSSALYGLLKAYLMLGDPQHEDKAFLTHWFYQDWQNPLMQNKSFTKHLDAAINGGMPVLSSDAALVQQTRATLNALPYVLLSNAILKNELTKTPPLPFSIENVSQSFMLPSTSVSELFTADGLHHVKSKVDDALFSAINGNWVLGTKVATNLSGSEVATLQKSLMSDYLQDYTQAWQTFLSSIHLKSFNSLTDVDNALQELTSQNSPLIQIIEFVQMNNVHNPNFATFNNLPIKVIFADLQNLEVHIHQMNTRKNSGETALVFAQTMAKQSSNDPIYQLQQHAMLFPVPVRDWLLTLANRSRDLIFAKASSYAWTQWQTQILPLYKSSLEGRYPFDQTASKDASLTDFAKFFEKGGIFNQFFTIYLSPFVDTTQAKWQWKSIDGALFSQDTSRLTQFERANVIQELYFNEQNQLIAPFTFAGKKYNWPIDTQTISITLSDGSVITEKGDWSIFKLLNHATVKSQSDGQNYDVIFTVNGHRTTAKLSAAPINPFVSGIVDQFKAF